MPKVFLGGTVSDSHWREDLIRKLKIDYYNPVVANWTPEIYEQELQERKKCDFCLYVVSPQLKGFYSIAEVVDDSNKQPEKTVFCIMESDGEKQFSEFQIRSLTAVGKMVAANGGQWLKNMDEVVEYLNAQKKEAVQ